MKTNVKSEDVTPLDAVVWPDLAPVICKFGGLNQWAVAGYLGLGAGTAVFRAVRRITNDQKGDDRLDDRLKQIDDELSRTSTDSVNDEPERNGMRHFIYALFMLIAAELPAANLNVPAFSTITVYPGAYYDSATVQSNATLIMSGGEIGTNLLVLPPSITVAKGGRFIFNDGLIKDFDNDGVVEFYGGRQSTVSSTTRGYVKLAGGDPGIQLIQYAGTVDVYYVAADRMVWEIASLTTDGVPRINIFSLTNTLAAGSYTYATLPSGTSNPYGKSYKYPAQHWAPASNAQLRTDLLISSNWPGIVSVIPYVPVNGTIKASIRRTSFVEVSWNSVSGRTYQVEDAFTLSAPDDWESLGTPVNSTGPTSGLNSAGANAYRFYRVLLRH